MCRVVSDTVRKRRRIQDTVQYRHQDGVPDDVIKGLCIEHLISRKIRGLIEEVK
jgi:hypothetical protein